MLSTIAALASTLRDELDKHIAQVMPLLMVASSEKNTFDPVLDGIKILSILFKSCKHGAGSNFIVFAGDMKDFLSAAITSSSPKVVG